MSNDLIRREDLIKKIFPYGMPDGGNYPINARAVMEAVMGVAAVDAEPVVYARWTFKSLDQIAPCCSNCEMQSIMLYPNCPYCRTKMKNGKGVTDEN